MFFSLSKVFWDVFAPSHVLVWLSVATCVSIWVGFSRLGKYLALATVALFIVAGVLPTFIWIARPIEARFTRPSNMPPKLYGILVLGGGQDDRFRLSAAYALARNHPGVRIVFSGGSNGLVYNEPGTDAKRAATFLTGLGFDPNMLTLENRSRNTWENFLFTRQLVRPDSSQTWVLATSALQMPRAMEIANRLNWKFLPWPTHWIAGHESTRNYFLVPENLRSLDESVREWIGLRAYRWSGKSVAITNIKPMAAH